MGPVGEFIPMRIFFIYSDSDWVLGFLLGWYNSILALIARDLRFES